MYHIVSENKNNTDFIKIINDSTGQFLSVIPEMGANINQLVLSKDGISHDILDRNLSRDDFKGKRLFHGAHLAPFSNRIEDGSFHFDGSAYQLPINYPEENNACHGFIYNQKFTIISTDSNDMSASLKLNYIFNNEIPGYPFKFSVTFTYIMDQEQGFTCFTEIKNLDSRAIPLSTGWHPYFKLDTQVDDLLLEIQAGEYFEVNDRMIPTGNRIPFDTFMTANKIGDTSLDTCFPVSRTSTPHITRIIDPAQEVTLELWQETGENKYNYVQIYIPEKRNSIAVEPVTSGINAFNTREGLITLKPGECFEGKFGIQIY